MKLRYFYKFAMIAACGGVVFTTTTSCSDQAMNAFITSMTPVLTAALTQALTPTCADGTTTTDSVPVSSNNIFSSVSDDIQQANGL